jgi:hypothetical protein
MTFLFTFSTLIFDFPLRDTLHASRDTKILSTTVERSLQINPFLTNKANFPKSQMNVMYIVTKDYEKMDTRSTREKQSQFKPNSNPIQTHFKPNTNPIQSQYKPKQSQFLYHWFCFLFTIASKSCELDKEFYL